MFEKLLDLLAQIWDRVSPLEIIKEYEGAVVLRFGRYNRTLEAGLHFKIPLVEEAISTPTCLTTLRLPPQTLTTRDDAPVVVSAIVKYEVRDVKSYLLRIWDRNDVLADVATGAIRTAISALTYAELVTQPPEQAVLEAVRKEVNQFGFKIHRVTFVDLGRVRSIRLIQPLNSTPPQPTT